MTWDKILKNTTRRADKYGGSKKFTDPNVPTDGRGYPALISKEEFMKRLDKMQDETLELIDTLYGSDFISFEAKLKFNSSFAMARKELREAK